MLPGILYQKLTCPQTLGSDAQIKAAHSCHAFWYYIRGWKELKLMPTVPVHCLPWKPSRKTAWPVDDVTVGWCSPWGGRTIHQDAQLRSETGLDLNSPWPPAVWLIFYSIFIEQKFPTDVSCSNRCLEEYLLSVSLGMGSGESKFLVPDKESYYAVKEIEHMEVRERGRVVEVLLVLISLSFPCSSSGFQDIPIPKSGYPSPSKLLELLWNCLIH